MFKKTLMVLLLFFWVLSAPADPSADTAWVSIYDGPGGAWDQSCALTIDGSGNVYVTGHSLGPAPVDGWATPDYATVKYDPSGNELWVRRYNGPGNSEDRAYDAAVDSYGNVYVTGMSIGSGTAGDYATVKYYPDGTVGWVRRYDGPASGCDCARGAAVDDFGNLYVTGTSIGDGTGLDYTTIKYDSSGNELWVERYNRSGSSWDYAQAITVDNSGNVFVTGYVGFPTGSDYATIKYHPNGDTVWLRRYNHSGNGYDFARAIAVDLWGNVCVTGDSWDRETGSDYATIKYRPNGETAWVRRYDGPGSNSDYANAIAVDAAGNVYVTGQSRGSGMDFDYATIMYDSSGTEIWVRRDDGPGNWDDCASAIAVDGFGNAHVTGMSLGVGTWFDYSTVTYDLSGTELWSKRENGTGNLGDYAVALTTDPSSNIYLTGYSDGVGTSADYATVKYYQCGDNNPPNPFSLLLPTNKSNTPRGVHFSWESAIDPDPSDQIRYDLHVSTSSHFPPDSTIVECNLTLREHMMMLDLGIHYWKVGARDNCGTETWSSQFGYFTVTGVPPLTMGDLNWDGSTDLGDVVFCVNYLYRSGLRPVPPEVGDCNCDGLVDVGDVVCLVNYLFKHGPQPGC